jgi:hypothetical protein
MGGTYLLQFIIGADSPSAPQDRRPFVCLSKPLHYNCNMRDENFVGIISVDWDGP